MRLSYGDGAPHVEDCAERVPGHLRRRLPDPISRTELTEIYGRLARWTDFWLAARRAPGAALPHYQHGNDSGWDNATTFDPERVVATADLAAFLTLQLRELARLATELDLPDEARRWTRTADATQAAMLDELWTGERFVARGVDSAATWDSSGLLDLMPMALGEHLPEHIGKTLAARIETHLTPYGLATELTTSPHYLPDGYWRGPIWAPPPSSSKTAFAVPGTSVWPTRSAPGSGPCAKPMTSPRTSTSSRERACTTVPTPGRVAT